MQRFDSGLRLNVVHFHTLLLDGVYVRQRDSGPLVFHELPAPSKDDVASVARRTAERVARILERAGRSLAPELDAGASPLADEPALEGISSAAAQGLDLAGPRAGQLTLRVVDPTERRPGERVVEVMGFNVHAELAVDGRDRERLERVCRYLGRPPIAQDRLALLPDGRVRYTMKKPWRDGTHALVSHPLDLIARLCAMVPPPGFHMIRFHGLLAGHAADRAEVVPAAAPAEERSATAAGPAAQLALFGEGDAGDPSDTSSSRRRPWAWLLRHVFAIDVTVCPQCSGPMRWREVATSAEDIARLLARHGHAARAPPPRPRRPPRGQLELDFGVAL